MRDETELEAVRRARDTVLANISHEFRTPLAAQLASIELLREGLDTMPPRAAARAGALAGARHAAPDAAHRQPARERAHRVRPARHPPAERGRWPRWSRTPRALIGSLLRQRGQRARGRAARGPAARRAATSTRLTQVFVNLLANASKFAPEGSTDPRRRAAPQDARTSRAWVEDEGPGLPDGDSASHLRALPPRPARSRSPAGSASGCGS